MANTKPKTLDEVELPDLEPYRVVIMGATYQRPLAVYGPTGPMLAFSHEVGARGSVILLDEAQARRLVDIGAVKPTDDPRSYDEMLEPELAQHARALSVEVRSSSMDPKQPLRQDYIDALQAFDAGVSSIAPVQDGPLAVDPPVPNPEQNPGPAGGAPSDQEPEVSEKVSGAPEATGANVNALATYLKRVTPNADETVAIAARDAANGESAQAVLDAERIATDNDPRATVEKRLLKMIEDGGGE